MKNLIKAVDWKPIKRGNKLGIQLYNEKGSPVEGKDAYWEGNFYCPYNKLTTLEGAPGTVGGHFYCYRNNLTTLEGAPSTVGGSFNCSYNKLTTLEGAPSTVGGNFYCFDNNLTTLEGAPKEASKEQLFQVFLDKGYIFADGILDRLISSKQLDDKTIYKVRKIGNSDTRFVVKRGNATSHGNTIKEAIEDLKYKISDRDTTEYEAWTLSTEASLEEMIQAYRKITGACSTGVKDFVKSINAPSMLTVKDAIEFTEGEYGNDDFVRFFDGGDK